MSSFHWQTIRLTFGCTDTVAVKTTPSVINAQQSSCSNNNNKECNVIKKIYNFCCFVVVCGVQKFNFFQYFSFWEGGVLFFFPCWHFNVFLAIAETNSSCQFEKLNAFFFVHFVFYLLRYRRPKSSNSLVEVFDKDKAKVQTRSHAHVFIIICDIFTICSYVSALSVPLFSRLFICLFIYPGIGCTRYYLVEFDRNKQNWN